MMSYWVDSTWWLEGKSEPVKVLSLPDNRTFVLCTRHQKDDLGPTPTNYSIYELYEQVSADTGLYKRVDKYDVPDEAKWEDACTWVLEKVLTPSQIISLRLSSEVRVHQQAGQTDTYHSDT